MAFENYENINNSSGILDIDLSTSGTIIQLESGNGKFFTANQLATLEHYETISGTPTVTKRQGVKITNVSTDTLTVEREFFDVRPNDTGTDLGKFPFFFAKGDVIRGTVVADDIKDIKTEAVRLENDKLDTATYNQERALFAASSTGNDNYVITDSTVSSYIDGKTYKVSADVANTGTATLEVNSLGVIALKKLKDGAFADLETGDIIANQIFWATYNSAESAFQFSVDPATATIPDVEYTKSIVIAGEDVSAGDALVLGNYEELNTSETFGFALASSSYDSKSKTYASNIRGFFIGNEGNKVYTMVGATIYQHTLTTAWDISTSTNQITKAVNSQETDPYGLFFKNDGTKMYIGGVGNDKIFQYTLTTAWDISTASYDSISYTNSNSLNVHFSYDGTKMYTRNGNSIQQHTLTTAWDISTASYDSISYTTSEDAASVGFYFKEDGLKLFSVGYGGDKVYQHTLTTAWDISTASYDSISYSVSGQNTRSEYVFFKEDGFKMYVAGNQTIYAIYQYSSTISSDGESNIGNNNNQEISQSFIAASNSFNDFTIKVKKVGIPADNLYIEIEGDNNGEPDGNILYTSNNLAGGTVSTSFVEYNFSFSGLNLTKGNKYYFNIRRSGILSDTDFFVINSTTDYTFTIGDLYYFDGVDYNQQNGRLLYFKLNNYKLGIKSDASDSNKINFVGFTTDTATSGNSVNIATSGVLDGFSGLTAGSDYFLSDTPGEISTTPGTNVVSVGKALSSTELDLDTKNVGGIFPRNIYVSPTRTGANNTVFTFNHNLGITENDVYLGKYKVILPGGLNGNNSYIMGDNAFRNDIFGSVSASSIYVNSFWSAADPSDQSTVHHQSNSVKIKLGSAGGTYLANFKLIIQQMF